MSDALFDRHSRSDHISIVMAAPWLGHGRAIECYLGMVAGLYGIILLLIPEAAFDSQATRDIAWLGYGQYLSIPLLLKSAFTSIGLLFNIRGIPGSRYLRFLGALIGTLIWTFLSVKFFILGSLASAGFPFSFVAWLFSIRIMGMALANLPTPGAPGIR